MNILAGLLLLVALGIAPLAHGAPSSQEEAAFKKDMAQEAKILGRIKATPLKKEWDALASALAYLQVSVRSGGMGSVDTDYLYFRSELVKSSEEVLSGKSPQPGAAQAMRNALSRFQPLGKEVPPIGSEPTIPRDLRDIKKALDALDKALDQHYAADPARAQAAKEAALHLYTGILNSLSKFIDDNYGEG